MLYKSCFTIMFNGLNLKCVVQTFTKNIKRKFFFMITSKLKFENCYLYATKMEYSLLLYYGITFLIIAEVTVRTSLGFVGNLNLGSV